MRPPWALRRKVARAAAAAGAFASRLLSRVTVFAGGRKFSAAQGRRKRYGMSKALNLCGLGLEGAHHRALDDAKNIPRLLPWIVGGQRLPTT